MKKRIHLICNAHLDPVWLWHWEDGLTEALSTYRIAADFCEKNPGFVFNHNEALLYDWVEKYEPQLFKRIGKLVASGQWHIAGGAWLQPDVNNASGESHIRQFLLGRRYFTTKFGVYPKTAYNFDPFGHAEGFPQILRGCGMSQYVFCRPDFGTYELPAGAFEWTDRSGAQIVARRSDNHYLTNGSIVQKLDRFLEHYKDEPVTMFLWGIGNHGGGPSKAEYDDLRNYRREHPEYDFVESTQDDYFAERLKFRDTLPVIQGEIEHSFPGCYTSMSRVKRAHREGEGLMAAAERLSALAWWWGCADYPEKDLEVAWKDILFSEFHDILPGSGVPTAEKDSVQLLGHAKEILRRVRTRAMLSVISVDPDARPEEVPVFVANPHGFPVSQQVEFELQTNQNGTAVQNPEIHLRRDGKEIACQRLQPEAICAGNWRVKLTAVVPLKPFEVARLDEWYENGKGKAWRAPKVTASNLTFRNKRFTLKINPRTGLVDTLSLPGSRVSLVCKNAFQPVTFDDLDHSWTSGDPKQMKSNREGLTFAPSWRKPSDRFRLATAAETAGLSPHPANKWGQIEQTAARPIRIIEHGAVRTVVEAVLLCGPSAVVRQYHVGHLDGLLEIRDRVFYNHRDTMLKVSIPLAMDAKETVSEALYSAVRRGPTNDHEDQTNQRWVAVRGRSAQRSACLAIANTGSFGHSFTGDNLALNVMRSPAYSSFNMNPEDGRTVDRFQPRHDQGEHEVAYRVLVGKAFRESEIHRAAAALNTPPHWQVYYPQPAKMNRARRAQISETIVVEDANVQVVAVKKAESGNALVIRLQDTAGRSRSIDVRVKPFRGKIQTVIGKYGLATLKVQKGGPKLRWKRVDLVER